MLPVVSVSAHQFLDGSPTDIRHGHYRKPRKELHSLSNLWQLTQQNRIIEQNSRPTHGSLSSSSSSGLNASAQTARHSTAN